MANDIETGMYITILECLLTAHQNKTTVPKQKYINVDGELEEYGKYINWLIDAEYFREESENQ